MPNNSKGDKMKPNEFKVGNVAERFSPCIIVKGLKKIGINKALRIDSTVFEEHTGDLKIECSDDRNKWQINIYTSLMLRKYISKILTRNIGG